MKRNSRNRADLRRGDSLTSLTLSPDGAIYIETVCAILPLRPPKKRVCLKKPVGSEIGSSRRGNCPVSLRDGFFTKGKVMSISKQRFLIRRMRLLLLCATVSMFWVPWTAVAYMGSDSSARFFLENDYVKFIVTSEKGGLKGESLEAEPRWVKERGTPAPVTLESDGDFAVDLMYTDWQAPGKTNNADNSVLLTKKDFTLVDHNSMTYPDRTKELNFVFKGKETTIDLMLTYRLEPKDFFIRKSIAVRDTAFGHHLLRWIWPGDEVVSGVDSVVKAGGFGQPVAILEKNGGAFFGLEYPTSQNSFEVRGKREGRLQCGQEYGQLIGKEWLRSEWMVEGITPDSYVKDWFFKYVDAIRVAPLRPVTLYNSWYDLRSPEYPKVPKEHWMSEANAMSMAKLLRENMVEKHNIKLDAFVLDDGWDVYESDWALRKEQWPNGLKPLADELKKTNTTLGLWMGPTGGYSFRMKRINWMKQHGYEVVGTSRDNAMLCIAGTNYSALLEKRVADFVKNDGVGYFKWDGIQFSCSEPNHGHPIDIYSRRAVMESVIDKCNVAHENNPNMFLNITSGTWLSPWWVKYANTIWMQGEDYGYSDVPSISQRDAAITYRDFVLYDDFHNLDCWFPIANLMTHGIIKGKLELLGSPEEPLDKFTDDALLYCARGVSMYELYISPDILSEGEWNTLSASLTWARDRFPILSSTYMIGGDPMKRECYGYVHFKGNRGIVAARNPFITQGNLEVELSAAQGLDPQASSLVVEQVYPVDKIETRLFKAGEKFPASLDGYETAIYEIYPLEAATKPLLAGVTFDIQKQNGGIYDMQFHSGSSDAKLLNPSVVASMTEAGKTLDPGSFSIRIGQAPAVAADFVAKNAVGKKSRIDVTLTLSETCNDAIVAILLTPDSALTTKKKPSITVLLDGNGSTVKSESQEGRSQWCTLAISPGRHAMSFEVRPDSTEKEWKGIASVWLIAQQQQPTKQLSFVLRDQFKDYPQPPRPWMPGEVRKTVKLGEVEVIAGSKQKAE